MRDALTDVLPVQKLIVMIATWGTPSSTTRRTTCLCARRSVFSLACNATKTELVMNVPRCSNWKEITVSQTHHVTPTANSARLAPYGTIRQANARNVEITVPVVMK